MFDDSVSDEEIAERNESGAMDTSEPDDEVPSTADFHRRHAKMLDATTASIEELRALPQHLPDRQREALERMLAPTILRLSDALELD